MPQKYRYNHRKEIDNCIDTYLQDTSKYEQAKYANITYMLKTALLIQRHCAV